MYQRHIRGVQRRVRQLGLTMVETLVALGIAGIVAALGLPALGDLRTKSVIESQVAVFQSALRRTRGEAIRREEPVTVCALDRDSVASEKPRCLSSGKDWSAGWLIFVDRGRRGEVNEGDRIVLVEASVGHVGALVGTHRYLTYRASGELLSLAAHFRFVPEGRPVVDQAVEDSALVCVNKPGKPRLSKASTCS